jgi:uncharacterized protein (UPF0332 family)
MTQYDVILINNCIEKAKIALSDAEQNLNISLYVSQNRSYYAIFYIVLALAYLDSFQTGKHHKLFGWFNKEYIYKNKIFDTKLKDIYQTLLANREKADYSFSETPEREQVEKGLTDAKFFVKTIEDYILKKIKYTSENKK